MRADRLISIIMLLQTHEKMTAGELSQQLEVSMRTIYRDILALNAAGVPIYTDRGPNGGIALLESYRTTLTGMNEDEIRALSMLNIPQALVELGVGQKLKSALLKLGGSLPASQLMVQAQTQQRIYLDSTSWDEPSKHPPHLGMIHQAVWQDQLVRLVYRGSFDAEIEFVVQPIGLVTKMNTWYFVGSDKGYVRVFNIAKILAVEITGENFTRDEGFNLVEFWKDWCKQYHESRPIYRVLIKITPQTIPNLYHYFGEEVSVQMIEDEPPNDGKWVKAIAQFEHFFQAREKILSLGRDVEVLEPEALKLSIIDFAKQIIDLYLDV